VSPANEEERLTEVDVRHIAPGIDNGQMVAIVATEASAKDLNEAIILFKGEDEVMGKSKHHLSPAGRAVYEILVSGEQPDDDE
jgi:hypothetical protein